MPGTLYWLDATRADYGYGYGGMSAPAEGPSHTSFVIWVAVLGLILPVLILKGFQIGGFRFVYHSGKLL